MSYKSAKNSYKYLDTFLAKYSIKFHGVVGNVEYSTNTKESYQEHELTDRIIDQTLQKSPLERNWSVAI